MILFLFHIFTLVSPQHKLQLYLAINLAIRPTSRLTFAIAIITVAQNIHSLARMHRQAADRQTDRHCACPPSRSCSRTHLMSPPIFFKHTRTGTRTHSQAQPHNVTNEFFSPPLHYGQAEFKSRNESNHGDKCTNEQNLHISNQPIYRSHISSQQQQQSEPQEEQQIDFYRSSDTLALAPNSDAIQESRHYDHDQSHHYSHHHYHQLQQPQDQQRQSDHHYLHETDHSHQVLDSSDLAHLIARHNQREQQILAANHGRPTGRSKQRSQIQFFLVAAFAYILSPIDLIPEAIFGIFGILDDLVFLLMCLFCVAIILLYPLFREVKRTMFEKVGFNYKREIENNKDS